MTTCPWCEAELEVFAVSAPTRIYLECQGCDWIGLSPEHYLSPEGQKTRYLQHENSTTDIGYVEMFSRFIASGVRPFVEPEGKLLDFGSGPGPVLADLLKQDGHTVDLYDPFFAPNKGVWRKKYDAIVMTEVLEHLEDPRKELERLAGRLKSRGVLSVMTLLHPQDRQRFGAWWYRRDPTHVGFYAHRTLGKMADVLGLELIHCDNVRLAVFQKP